MKKYMFLSAALLLFTASCSNDENSNEAKEPTQTIQFSFTNEDFGEDEALTRANAAEAKPQIVDLGDCEAEISVESEPAAKTRGAKKPANGHYTIRAYQAGTLKGEMKGTFGGGTFTPDAGTEGKMLLSHGTYDFIAFNNDVTPSGTNLTVVRNRAETAMIGTTTAVINQDPEQKVQFTMKHVGCRLRTQFVCKKDIPNNITAMLEATAANVIPATVAYSPATKAYTGTNGIMTAETNNSPASTETKYIASIDGQNYSYTSTCADYHYFLPTTESNKLKLSFSAGTIFWKPLTGTIPQLSASLSMQAGKSYLIKIKLKPQFTYLMSDGTTGHFKDTTFGGGTKTPIAVVVDESSHMAIALNDANGGMKLERWCSQKYVPKSTSTHMVPNLADALNSQATSGIDETWNASYSTSTVTGNKVKGLNPDFNAIKAAADYNPGVTYTGSPALKWYLPSYSDWKWLYSWGFEDKTAVTQVRHHYKWYGALAESAFTQVGGTLGMSYTFYWSSSESIESGWPCIGSMHLDSDKVEWSWNWKDYNNFYVRPFVAY